MFSFVEAGKLVRRMHSGMSVKLDWYDGGSRYICIITPTSGAPLLDNFMAFDKKSGTPDPMYSPISDSKFMTYKPVVV